MATHTLKKMLSRYIAVAQPDQNIRDEDIDQASGVMVAARIPPERRCETRKEYRGRCSYETLEPIDEESVVIERGDAFALNRSTEGILLFVDQAPHAKQVIEVHTPHSRWGWTANVFEVRWTRPVQVESFGNLYLVGCRRIFGPCHYLSF